MARPPLSSFVKKPPLETFTQNPPQNNPQPGMATMGMPFPISQEYGNYNPELETQSGGVNYGRDYATPPGTPVTLPEGTWRVVNATSGAGAGSINDWTNQGYGNSVLVRNEDTGEYLRASHLSDVQVEPDQIIQGGVIGMTGASGHVTGPHLDLEYYTPEGEIADVSKTPYADVVMDKRQIDATRGLDTPSQAESATMTPYSVDELVGTPPVEPQVNAYAEGTPEEWKPMFDRASQETGIPTHILSSQTKAESNFDPNAVSGVGALGPSQFMPATAQEVGLQDPTDPAQSIPAQAKYLKSNMDLLGGDTDQGLAAYNAGLGNVQEYGGIPPFEETQGYIKRINDFAKEATAGGQLKPQVANEMMKVSKEKQKPIPFWKQLLGLQ